MGKYKSMPRLRLTLRSRAATTSRNGWIDCVLFSPCFGRRPSRWRAPSLEASMDYFSFSTRLDHLVVYIVLSRLDPTLIASASTWQALCVWCWRRMSDYGQKSTDTVCQCASPIVASQNNIHFVLA